MFRSPLMVGGNLPRSDAGTVALLSNPEVLAIDQQSTGNRELLATTEIVIWLAEAASGKGSYLAIFNRGEKRQNVHYQWKDLGLADQNYKVRDLWQRRDIGAAQSLAVQLPPHDCILYRVQP